MSQHPICPKCDRVKVIGGICTYCRDEKYAAWRAARLKGRNKRKPKICPTCGASKRDSDLLEIDQLLKENA